MKKRYVRVAPSSVTPAMAEAAQAAIQATALEGIDKNPTPIPGESLLGFRRRMAKERGIAAGDGLTKDENDALYHEAFSLFCNGLGENRHPTVAEIGIHLKMHLPSLLETSIKQKWELLRANAEAANELAQNEGRLQIARRIDRVIFSEAEQIVLKAAEVYREAILKIAEQSTDPKDYGAPEPTLKSEPIDGLPIPSPDAKKKKPEMFELNLVGKKVGALNEAVRGFMDMAERARNLGLLVVPKDGTKESEDAGGGKSIAGGRLLQLNLTLLQAKGMKDEKNVTP